MPEDAAEPLDFAAVTQVLGGKGMEELVCVDPEADPSAGALEEVGDTLDVDRSAIAEQ
ncbi:MAG TPA: hypothetical protein VHK65_14280 [Candidatus Dormibacteraeota bacterium]|nr:hypothetical protein [Candidatus Dormibacteraeota bacterium]